MLSGSKSTVRPRLLPFGAAAKALAACAAGLAGTAAVFAADVPPAPPPIAATSWAGFYLGVHGGYGRGDNSFSEIAFTLPPFSAIPGVKSKGGLVGGQAGYNWQYGRAVTGVEIDWSAANIGGDSATVTQVLPALFGTLVASRSNRVKYLGTTRGRVGWLPTDNVLLYATAGAAWERIDETQNLSISPPTNLSVSARTPFDRLGWVAGVGVEAMPFGPNWIGRLEYLHYDFGAVAETQGSVSSLPGGTFSDRAGRQTIDTVRAALSYKFDAPGVATQAMYAKAPAVAAASGWAGFYLGAHGGYGSGDNNFSSNENDVPPVQIGGVGSKGGVYGGQAGYNWQFGRAISGLELDLSAAAIKGSAAQVNYVLPGGLSTVTVTLSEKVAALGSIRARLGWLPTENVLLYGTAGLGWERLDRTVSRATATAAGVNTFVTDSSADHFGWVAGVGVETMLPGGNWIGRLEYLHYGFGPVVTSAVVTTVDGTFISTAGNHGVDVLRAGLSYKFDGPVAAAQVHYAKAPAIVPSSNWAGFYLGADGGYGWKDNAFTAVIDTTTAAQVGGIKSRGWLAGGHAGYNWQYGRLVTGLETDFSFSGIKGSSAPVIRTFPAAVWRPPRCRTM